MAEQKLREFKKVHLADLSAVAFEISEFLEKPAVIFLKGEVGAGKTTFVQSFLDVVYDGLKTSSPTYALVHEIEDILHSDLYRLESPEELIPVELELLMEDKELVFIEWPDRFQEHLYDLIDSDFTLYQIDIFINGKVDEGERLPRNFIFSRLSK